MGYSKFYTVRNSKYLYQQNLANLLAIPLISLFFFITVKTSFIPNNIDIFFHPAYNMHNMHINIHKMFKKAMRIFLKKTTLTMMFFQP